LFNTPGFIKRIDLRLKHKLLIRFLYGGLLLTDRTATGDYQRHQQCHYGHFGFLTQP